MLKRFVKELITEICASLREHYKIIIQTDYIRQETIKEIPEGLVGWLKGRTDWEDGNVSEQNTPFLPR